tara:strand:- start:1369 stop:1881 length:513 start_codon:yes stop_codon:yes gene_type:complete
MLTTLLFAAIVIYVITLLVSVATKSRINKPLYLTGGAAIIVASVAAYAAAYNSSDKGAVVSAPVIQTFDQVDAFKRNAARRLLNNTDGHTIVGVAHELSLLRVDNTFAVCSDQDEIESTQYLELAQIIDPLSSNAPQVGNEIEVILSQDQGITDCQFRVIEAIAQQSKSS